jgi:hypothetical protein
MCRDKVVTSTAAVDSALRRARARLAEAGPVADDLAEPDEGARRSLLDSYVDAFTRADADALVGLLRADVRLEMPPTPTWFTGRAAVVGFFATRVMRAALWRMTPTRANGQPAVVVHKRDGDGWRPYAIQVLTLIGDRVAHIVAFNDPALVSTFEGHVAAKASVGVRRDARIDG